jgi:AraC-like DNA-binding protein
VDYRELLPIPELADFVDCVWTLTGDARGTGDPQPVLPDGRPELIVHFGDPFQRLEDAGGSERQGSMLFAGQLTRQLTLQPTGVIAVLGIRFQPHGAAGFMAVPQHELAGVPIGLDAISPLLARDLRVVQDSAAGVSEAAVLAQHVLARSLERSAVDPRVRFAVDAIQRSRGRLSIDRLAEAAGLTRRHLERRFLPAVGVSPKRLARLARFQHALQVLGSDASPSGADTALACGYADQSHFIRDFRSIAGCSPGEHLLRRGEITGFFIGADEWRSAGIKK